MTFPRSRHSLTGRVACGGRGEESSTSCEELEDGHWKEVVTLNTRGRRGHSAWPVNGTLLLLGDFTDEDSHGTTTEIVTGNSTESFYQLRAKSSLSCGIDDVERSQLILTGGLHRGRDVDIYRLEGHDTRMPSLHTGRHSHGCAGYYRQVYEGVKGLVLVVTGGLNSLNRSLVSTEMFQFNADRDWNYVSSLPGPVTGLRGVTIDNRIFMTGGYNNNAGGVSRRDVLRYDVGQDQWVHVGDMRTPRAEHAVSPIKIEDGFTEDLDCVSTAPTFPRPPHETEDEAEDGEVGILITGGRYKKAAEVFLPSRMSECSVRSLPTSRRGHSQTGLTLCGGYSRVSLDTCLVWRDGNWEEKVSLQHRRYSHVACHLQDSILLLGGGWGEEYNKREDDCHLNAELVTRNSSKIAFPLKYKLK